MAQRCPLCGQTLPEGRARLRLELESLKQQSDNERAKHALETMRLQNTIEQQIRKNGQFLAMMIALTFLVTVGWRLEANAEPLLVQAEGSQGFAAPRNTEPANFLVVVTRQLTGAPVTNLDQSDFAIVNHFSLPGQRCGFSNQIISFVNVGTGAYQIQVGLPLNIPRCTWVQGDYLAQIIVSSGLDLGQATAILSIKKK